MSAEKNPIENVRIQELQNRIGKVYSSISKSKRGFYGWTDWLDAKAAQENVRGFKLSSLDNLRADIIALKNKNFTLESKNRRKFVKYEKKVQRAEELLQEFQLEYIISFSMREDGFEMDQFILSKDAEFMPK